MRRSLSALRARIERLEAQVFSDAAGPVPSPDDPRFMAWAVERYGLKRILEHTVAEPTTATRGSDE